MRSGQKRTARRRGVTFRALVVLPFCVALGIQGVVCATVLARSEILKQMEIDAYDLFSERVASRAGYLEKRYDIPLVGLRSRGGKRDRQH